MAKRDSAVSIQYRFPLLWLGPLQDSFCLGASFAGAEYPGLTPNVLSTPPASCRVVLQFQPNPSAQTSLRHHRLHAAWSFTFNLIGLLKTSFRDHRLHAAWSFNFNLPLSGSPL